LLGLIYWYISLLFTFLIYRYRILWLFFTNFFSGVQQASKLIYPLHLSNFFFSFQVYILFAIFRNTVMDFYPENLLPPYPTWFHIPRRVAEVNYLPLCSKFLCVFFIYRFILNSLVFPIIFQFPQLLLVFFLPDIEFLF